MLSARPWDLRCIAEHLAIRLQLHSPTITGAITNEYRDGYLRVNIEREDGTAIPLVIRKYELFEPTKLLNNLLRDVNDLRRATPGLNFIAVVATRGDVEPELQATKLAEERICIIHVPGSPPRYEARVSFETSRASSIFLNKLT